MEKFPFDSAIHLKAPPAIGKNKERVLELLNLMKNGDKFDELWCTEHTITLFLIARNYDVQAAYTMMMFAGSWRNMRQAHLVELQPNWVTKMSKESETGKIWCPGSDQWGRPVVIFDNTVQNTNSVDDQMLFLAWCLEFAIKDMPEHTDKYVVFMHLRDFSFFNTPPFASTKETAQMLCNCFPERAGHIVLYQPPYIFEAFYNSIQYLVDIKTRSKIVFVRGDDAIGTENDQKLNKIIGPNWRELTGSGQDPIPDQVAKYGRTSPGYNHDAHWNFVHRRIAARPTHGRIYTSSGKVTDNNVFGGDEGNVITMSSDVTSVKSSSFSFSSRSENSSSLSPQCLNDSTMIDSNVYSYLENMHAPPLAAERKGLGIGDRSPSQIFQVPVATSIPPPSPNNRSRYKYIAPTLQ